jgi:hypothetical protein
MNESKPTFESAPEISREQALGAYKKFIERGITSPDALDLDDPEVIEANEMFEKWQASLDSKSAGDADAERRANFEKTMFYVDAGFADPAYLEEVLGWLMMDGADVEKNPDNEDTSRLRADIARAMQKIRDMLRK